MTQPKRSAEEILEFVQKNYAEITDCDEYDWGRKSALQLVEEFILGGGEK